MLDLVIILLIMIIFLTISHFRLENKYYFIKDELAHFITDNIKTLSSEQQMQLLNILKGNK